MSKGVKVSPSIIVLAIGAVSLCASMTRDYRGRPYGTYMTVLGGVCIFLGALFLVLALRKRTLEGEKTLPKESPLKRPSSTQRFLRGISILWFVIAVYIVTSAVCSLAGARGIRFFAMAFALGVLFVVLSVFVIRRLSMNICRAETPRVVSYDRWLIAIGLASVVVWIRAFPDIGIPDLVWQVAYLFCIVAAIVVSFKSRVFLFRNYAVVGIAIGSCLATTMYPAMIHISSLAQSFERTRQFAEVIKDCRELATESQFYAAMVQETNVVPRQGLEGGVLVLEANGEREPFDLKAHPWESTVPTRLLAADPASIRSIVIVASYGWRAQSPTRARNLSDISGLPVLLFSWPDKRILGKTKVSIILSKPVSDIWGERFVDRRLASQLEQIISGSR